MQLYDSDGSAFKLTIIGYEFPHLAGEPYDSNWLIIQVDVTTPDRSWRASDPCLLTYEVERLANWLEQAANGIPDKRECSFMEPCLQFELLDRDTGERILRIVFDLELRPDWQTLRTRERDDIWLEFQVDSRKLLLAAQALREQWRRYPQRTAR